MKGNLNAKKKNSENFKCDLNRAIVQLKKILKIKIKTLNHLNALWQNES